MGFLDDIRRKVMLFDGAMGTEIQKLDIGEGEWGGYQGCNEILSISSPERIAGIYRSYLDAGSDIFETNTFGAQKLTLQEHGLAGRTEELNRASSELARRVLDQFRSEVGDDGRIRYIAGSMGPGTKLPSLGHTDFESLHDSYLAQARGLIDGGVDLFIVETAQDPLQIKAAVLAIRDAQGERNTELPVVVSITVETNGAMLVGTDIAAAVTILEPLEIDVLGINCATGPKEMRPHIKELAALYRGPVFCMPNAGFPEHRDGRLVYDLGPQEYAEHLISFVSDYGVDVIGGCCGTDPSYIAELRRRLDSSIKPERSAENPSSLASLYSRQELTQEPAPFFVGERTNTNGSKKFRERLLEDDWQALEEMGKAQQRVGAHGIDVCVAYAGRDEKADMRELIGRLSKSLDRPIVIDSTDPEVVETGLKLIGGRALINSVNLEDGPEHARKLFGLAKRYGAAIIALTIDEEGMARSIEQKMEIASRLLRMAVDEIGLQPQDLVIDPLTFTLGSGEESLRDAGFTTIEAVRRIKKELGGVHTILGVSNISYGLTAQSREVLNSIFLHEAVDAGLDLAIVNVKKIIPLHSIPKEDREAALDLIYLKGAEDPLLRFIRHFEAVAARRGEGGITEKSPEEGNGNTRRSMSPVERLQNLVIDGSSHDLEKTIDEVMEETAPEQIISDELIPAMKRVGDMFGEGEIQLPFVLQSAEVMKKAVDYLQPFMSKTDSQHKVKVVLATVRGDVHDIGKNLVDIILTNNGYEVYNLGIKVDIDMIIEKTEEVGAHAVAMSGLLVKSTAVMKEYIEIIKSRGLDIPVLLGGAALTSKFVERECAPILESPVYYCRDAFDGLNALSSLERGETGTGVGKPAEPRVPRDPRESREPAEAARQEPETPEEPGAEKTGTSPAPSTIFEPLTLSAADIPSPPHWHLEREEDEEVEALFDSLNFKRLVRGRWGYKSAYVERASKAPADLSDKGALQISEEEAEGILESLKVKIERERILEPKAVFRWMPCRSDGDTLFIYEPEGAASNPARAEAAAALSFPRQEKAPRRCISDFFLSKAEPAPDLIGLQIVTMGSRIGEAITELFRTDRYKEYLLLHGLAVELTETYADIIHHRMEARLGLVDSTDDLRAIGTRFSVGYTCCPNLSLNRKLAELLSAENIGVTFTEGNQMVPEFSTSAFVSFHPEAYYFSL